MRIMKKIILIVLVLFFLSFRPQEVSAFKIKLPFVPIPTIPKPIFILPTRIPRPIWKKPSKPTPTTTIIPTVTSSTTPTPTVTNTPTPTNTPTSTPTLTPTATPTSTPTPAHKITLASNLPANIANSGKVSIPWGYKSMTIHVTASEMINFWSLQVSFDYGQSWHEQHKFSCVNTDCPEVTVPILRWGNYSMEVYATYRIFAHSNSNSALVDASAILNEEPTARVETHDLHWNITYGYVTGDLLLNGFSTITITAGGGYSTLEGISLLKWEDDTWKTQFYLSCSNNMCPLETLPFSDGMYRFKLDGSNPTVATLGFILRK